LAGFLPAGPLSWLNWNFKRFVFQERENGSAEFRSFNKGWGNLMISELFYAQSLSMNRGSFNTSHFRRIHLFVFGYRLTKHGFAGPKSFQRFEKRAPRRNRTRATLVGGACEDSSVITPSFLRILTYQSNSAEHSITSISTLVCSRITVCRRCIIAVS